ncbi:MAG: hypothetical protein JWL59_4737 [Chthoniobacteraceae bacterium]|nr:hypothetical protein [Chthoniobacteraceae bacterium]
MSPTAQFLQKLRAALESDAFVKITLSRYHGEEAGLRNIYGRMVELKEGRLLSLVFHHATRDVTKNYSISEAVDQIIGPSLSMAGFESAHLFTTTGDWQLRCHVREEKSTLKASRPVFTLAPEPEHDRRKVQSVAQSAPFLQALGVANSGGEPRPGMADKLRQIQRFVEILGHLLADTALRPADSRELRVLDMGAGKGYLTFATCEFLQKRGLDARVTGVELRADLVALTNQTARQVGYEKLEFVEGAIGAFEAGQVDILIALHACDTATDDALFQGIRAGASLIVTAPCCHKEIRAKLTPPDVLHEIMRHGILHERQAEIVTDAIRALLLEIHGYKASVFEFISSEHTGKNLMIAATKRPHPLAPDLLRRRLHEMLDFYGIREQHLAMLLGELNGVDSAHS